MTSTRNLKYSEALGEALWQAMEANANIFAMGEGIDDPKAAFGTTRQALEKFGGKRVFDTPLSEAAMTGMGIGAAIAGLPNVMIHMRGEFILYAMDQVVNHAAKWRYMSGGQLQVPIVIRSIIGRGWGQAAQHSQSLQSIFCHFPGLKVVMPSNAYDAKGLLYSAILDPNPVLFFEHRWLYDKVAPVPEKPYSVELGKAGVCRAGKDVTIVATSYQVLEALAAAEFLHSEGIEAEVIDLRTVFPFDLETVLSSVKKTGRLLLTDTATLEFGWTGELCAQVQAQAFGILRAPILRVGLPAAPTPCSSALEESFYPKSNFLVEKVLQLLRSERVSSPGLRPANPDFFGPF